MRFWLTDSKMSSFSLTQRCEVSEHYQTGLHNFLVEKVQTGETSWLELNRRVQSSVREGECSCSLC